MNNYLRGGKRSKTEKNCESTQKTPKNVKERKKVPLRLKISQIIVNRKENTTKKKGKEKQDQRHKTASRRDGKE